MFSRGRSARRFCRVRCGPQLAGIPNAELAGKPNAELAGKPNAQLAGKPNAQLAGKPNAELAGGRFAADWWQVPATLSNSLGSVALR